MNPLAIVEVLGQLRGLESGSISDPVRPRLLCSRVQTSRPARASRPRVPEGDWTAHLATACSWPVLSKNEAILRHLILNQVICWSASAHRARERERMLPTRCKVSILVLPAPHLFYNKIALQEFELAALPLLRAWDGVKTGLTAWSRLNGYYK